MERIQSINPERIRWCCADRGITPEALASELGIAASSFEQVMVGEGGLTFNQLRKVAEYFNRGALFFLESGPITEEQVHTPQFRTIANQKPELSAKLRALVERVERQRDVYISLREDLGETEQLRYLPPQLPSDNILRAAENTRQWLGLADKNDFASYRGAVESKQVLVFQSNGYNGPWQIPKENPICGFALYDPICPVIVIKKLAYESRQVFTLMHELGHVLLHQSSFIDDEDDLYSYQGKEREANAFAGYLLVPDVFLELVNDGDRPDLAGQYDAWLRPYRNDWGVSGEVILRRLLDAGRLNQKRYDAYRAWKKQQSIPESEGGTRQYRYREPKHMFGEPFVQTVLDALHAKQISLAKASTYLDNLKIADVHQLEGFYAGL
jgi:Zn-dependent peptidase ImmA (M78 family)